eukprot:TRINITY_DN476_c0_g1_i1.p1 TRINITY_DN476_c0_g1~~TRINITY_DN476_c0_g1_i1.p1  ORF type:complete len:486 (+),score=187.97 TRINITY_DN476_c0_g1_i1:88-1458(+)
MADKGITMLDQAGAHAKDITQEEKDQGKEGPRSALGQHGDTTVKYWKKKQVGAGSYGEAWLAETSDTHKQICVKVMNIPKMSDRDLHYAYSEIKCLTRLKHPNIIAYIEDFEEGDNLYIVMEFANCGDMDRQIRSRAKDMKFFQEHEALFMFLQLTMGLDHIHSKKMLHRDLKSANIFLTSDGMAKLGDFGFSHDYEETVSNAVAKTFCGTPYYLAPELWKNKKYGKKADVWSLGVVLYEMVALKRPFAADSMKGLMKVVLEQDPSPLPGHLTKGMTDLVMATLTKDAKYRPTTRDLYAMDFMQNGLEMYESAIKRSPTLAQDAKDQLFAEVAVVRSCKGKSMSSADASQPATARDVHHEGPVRKLGTSERSWKDRYLCLRDAALVICDSPETISEGKGLPLSQIRSVCAVASNACSEQNVFGLETVKGRATWLQAPSAEAMDKWLEQIQLCLSLL